MDEPIYTEADERTRGRARRLDDETAAAVDGRDWRGRWMVDIMVQ